jgi:hypothetical protein
MAIRYDKVRIELSKDNHLTSIIIDVPAILEVMEGRKHDVREVHEAGTIHYSLVDENAEDLKLWDAAYQSKASKEQAIYMDESMTRQLGVTYYGKGHEEVIDVSPKCLIELRGIQGYDERHMRIFHRNGLDNLMKLENDGYGWFNILNGGNND